MDIYGLVGKKLTHSFSPDYFNNKFKKKGIDAEYKLFEIDNANELPKLIKSNPNLVGLNVTIPYKKSLFYYLDFFEKTVHLTGSVNTIKIIRNNNETKLYGYNTDVIGFEKTLVPLIKKRKQISALIIGTGGSAKSVAYVLRKLGILFTFVSRNYTEMLQYSYQSLNKQIIDNNLLIINTSPVGMYPDINSAPNIPYKYLTNNHILYDLVYNPLESQFIINGKQQGATCVNGLKMLEIQARASWKIWRKK